MSKGTVKDPTGHQSPGHAFGYLQRVADEKDLFKDLKWPDKSEQMKAIPYLNRDNEGQPIHDIKKVNTPVDFVSKTAYVCVEIGKDNYKPIGDIGIAVLTSQGWLIDMFPPETKEETSKIV